MQNAWGVLQESLTTDAFPGVVAGVANHKQTLLLKAGGFSRLKPTSRPLRPHDLFDLASVTKPVATATSLLRLVQLGRASLDEPASAYIKEWRNSEHSQITIRHLLTHTSGLPAWFPTYVEATNKEETLALITKLGLVYQTGSRVEYSCLGYIILGILIERISGLNLDTVCQQLVFAPLGMQETVFRPLQTLQLDADRIVYNEADSEIEKSMTHRAGFSFAGWRKGYDLGAPNDGNACYSMKGISGNAGLFGTAGDLLTFGQAWLRSLAGHDGSFLTPSLARLAISNQTPGLNESRGLGWLLFNDTLVSREEMSSSPSMIPYVISPTYLSPRPRSSGELLSKQAFGHTGFTGTSLWIDPEKDLVVVLLTNHLHTKSTVDLNTVRARFHNAIVGDLGL